MSLHGSQGPSRRSILRGAAVAGAAAALSPLINLSAAQAATSGTYTIRFDNGRKQTILGLGFEIQSDSIGSGNNGLPDLVSGVPYDLTESERTRFYQQMLKAGRSDRGFRYCRLAMGLYYRGLDSSRKLMGDRYPGQAAQLAAMCDQAGVEGLSVEYWSPAPAWKTTDSYIKGRLKSFTPEFLDEFSDALVADLDRLTARGLRISQWGLQNEPRYATDYSSCQYSGPEYLATFKAVAPKIRAKYPHVMITADSQDGWGHDIGKAILADPQALDHVDAWTYHRIGYDSDYQIDNDFRRLAQGKPVFNNEFEYLSGEVDARRTINTAQSIMNWMTFQDSPTWYWLHALKPTTNSESLGYSLGLWRPPHDTDFSKFGHIQPGHWDFNARNWNSVAGFVKYMPWDSVRYHVEESTIQRDQRIMAWKTPAGKPVFALTNRSATESFTYTIDTQTSGSFEGHRYTPTVNDQRLAPKTGPQLTVTLPPHSIEFWVRTP
ncbi:hypothetical protein ACGFOW_04380 [Streptomyces rubiginosohelvolus]|uniref:hypothetical protein n=1 Tax=Streptomyces rubiginosohelvolus TaxID=67362 RepID=UPI00371C430E